MDLSVLIVCYHARDLVDDCLRGLLANTNGIDFEVLLLDNSDDGAVELVRQRFPSVRVIDNDENLGFARGNNRLAEHANGDYLLLLNPDTLIEDNAVGRLVGLARSEPRIGACGGMCMLPGGEIDPGCQQPGPGWRSAVLNAVGLGRFYRGGVDPSATQPADVAVLSGAFMMVRTDVWRQLSGFDESFVLYNEEPELCRRVRQAGYRVVMSPESRIVHLVGGGDADKPGRRLKMVQSRMHYNRKFHGPVHVGVDGAIIWAHAASRYWGSLAARPWLGPDRATALRQGFRDIATQPGRWWGGYKG